MSLSGKGHRERQKALAALEPRLVFGDAKQIEAVRALEAAVPRKRPSGFRKAKQIPPGEHELAAAREQGALVDRLQEALEANDTLRALELAREVCGMEPERKH